MRESEASTDVLDGRYRIGALVRESRLGEIREGEDLIQARPVRVMVARPRPNPEATTPSPDDFDAAIGAASRIPVVPGAPWVHDVGVLQTRDGAVRWIASEPAHGTLVAEVRLEDLSDLDRSLLTLRVARHLATLLEHLHAAGVVHGAIGPTTVTVAAKASRDGDLTVGITDPGQDFGPAADRRDDVAGIGRVIESLLGDTASPGVWDQLRDASVALDLGEELRRIARQLTRPRRAERPYSIRVVSEQLAALHAAVAADLRAPGSGFAVLEATISTLPPSEVADLLGRLSARLPSAWLDRLPGWRATVERLDLPVRATTPGSRTRTPDDAALAAYHRRSRVRTVGRGAAVCVVALLAAAAVAGIAFWRPTATAAPSVSVSPTAAAPSGIVPRLVGTEFSGVVAALARAGLRLGQVALQDGDDAAGRVLAASATPGSRLGPGAAVDVTVASGRRAVPRGLVGRTQDDAVAALRAAGFRVRVDTLDTSDYVAGYVLDVSPSDGAVPGAVVTLTVAREADPEPEPTEPMPDPSSDPSATPTPPTTRGPTPHPGTTTPRR